uniref:PH domain-containing protein n=1 Tax=Biomphalaria glabrata TaxID=6526 RepID=A0A2C9LRI7_BIOGL
METLAQCQDDTKNWKLWHELLPGIEEFLTSTLAAETLSSFAEERRQFFIECLDIIKLPPTVPPREGRKLSPEILKTTEEVNGVPVEQTSDFAAAQREISRSLADPVTNPYQDDPTDEEDNASEKGTKVYDDIDPTDSLKEENVSKPTNSSDGDCDNDDENDLYEIPVARLQLSSEENSISCGVDGCNAVTIGSIEDFSEDMTDSNAPPLPLSPPPLPPRKDGKFFDFGSRNSLNAEERPPELPFRPLLAKRNELYVTHSEKSDRSGERSDGDLSGDGDSTSYESFDETVDAQDQEFRNKNNIKLPKRPKKKSGLKKNKKLSKSRSSSQWEISVPFRKLENILLSGELYHKGKLSWNRRLVAISNGCLAMYKPDKDARPSMVISLSGYEALVQERDGRRGFEIKMAHPTQDSYTFSVDFRDWAYLWADHINGVSKGQPLPKYETHLARAFTGNSDYGATGHMGSKNDLTSSNSNLSTGSEGTSEDSSKARLRGNKVMRMGSFAFRATQFFESIGKKSTKPRKSTSNMTSVSSGDYSDLHNGIVEESSVSSSTSVGNTSPSGLTPTSDLSLPNVFSDSSSAPNTPMDNRTPISWKGLDETQEEIMANVDHKGYLFIFSTFNRRKWGKRWCLVRENMFECYRTQQSRQCELNFLLRPCTIRRAVVETNSELGLMILESGKEKITVEPISKEEMSSWVQVLLSETSTGDVPQGLEDFIKVKDSDSQSLMSLTVLRQWDMIPSKDMTSSHDYEDPLDTTLTAKQFHASYQCAGPSEDKQLLSDEGALGKNLEALVLVNGDTHSSDVSDSTSSSNKTKHTTDSGFYSVKGNNSDSETGSENSTQKGEDIDCGYAALDSLSCRSVQHSCNASNISDFTEESLPCVDINQNENVSPSNENQCFCVQSSSIAIKHSTSTNKRTSKLSKIRDSYNPVDKQHTKSKPPSDLTIMEQNSMIATTATILSPNGDEYSIVIKRSVKSKSPEPNTIASNQNDTHQCSESQNSDKKLHINERLFSDVEDIPVLPLRNVSDLENSIPLNVNIPSYRPTSCSLNSSPVKDTTNNTNLNAPTHIHHKPSQWDQGAVPKIPSQPADKKILRVSPIKVVDNDSLDALKNNTTIPSPNSSRLNSELSPFKGESPLTPKVENITDLIDNPFTTPEDLKAAVERLKLNLSKLKKKRMAVHEKRQKVLSDEERLVCEKELAALERDAENTDLDIRVLQNQLDTVQGQTFEAMKAASGRKKSGAKKKKHKRKS